MDARTEQKTQPAAKAAVFAWRVYRFLAKKSLALYRNKCYNALANFVEATGEIRPFSRTRAKQGK